jgi:hypothetical protein
MGDFLEDHATNLRIDIKPVIGPAMVLRHDPTSEPDPSEWKVMQPENRSKMGRRRACV